MLKRLLFMLAFIGWGIVMCTFIIPLGLYIITGYNWMDDGIEDIQRKFNMEI